MLSNMLRDHPDVLSISEFFSLITDFSHSPEPFSPEAIDGRRFWELVAGITPRVTFALQHRILSEEWLYPGDEPAAAFSWQTGVPAILLTTLPHLTEVHDEVYYDLEREVRMWPTATLRQHYENLFGEFGEHFGKRLWIERSGSSLAMVDRLLEIFPDAKFIHIVRDGRDTAVSIRSHPVFRLGLTLNLLEKFLGVDPVTSQDRTHIDRVPLEYQPFLPERFDPEEFNRFQLSLPLCAKLWTIQVARGLSALESLPDERLLTLRYEDFFGEAKRQLDTLAAFLGEDFVDEDWSQQCAATVRQPRSTWRDLPSETARALTDACRPGFDQLRAAGIVYDV
jgi:putative sulfotransferase